MAFCHWKEAGITTVTVTLWDAEPAELDTERVYVVVWVGAITSVAPVTVEPLTWVKVAPVADQVRVVLPPWLIWVAAAVKDVMTGALVTLMVTLAVTVPARLVAVRV